MLAEIFFVHGNRNAKLSAIVEIEGRFRKNAKFGPGGLHSGGVLGKFEILTFTCALPTVARPLPNENLRREGQCAWRTLFGKGTVRGLGAQKLFFADFYNFSGL